MVILGIDPGFAIIGYGVIEKDRDIKVIDYGVITTPKEDNITTRLETSYKAMVALIDKFKPDAIAIEELFYFKNQTTIINVAQARGIIVLACAQSKLPIYEYTPLQVKQAITGNGRAEKKQVIALVGMILGMENGPKLDDTADALALAICHAHTGTSRMQEFYNQKKKRLL